MVGYEVWGMSARRCTEYEERYLAFTGDSLFTWGTIDDYPLNKDDFIVVVGTVHKNK